MLADETRPFLQGARLTAWELHKDAIPVTVIADVMAGHLMKQGEIDVIVVGADRIAANGDTANKIGTYTVAVLAQRHGIPFYIAAPTSTVDLDTPDGDAIPIEERGRAEVAKVGETEILPDGVPVRHPAFDVTPNELIAGIITEMGVAQGAVHGLAAHAGGSRAPRPLSLPVPEEIPDERRRARRRSAASRSGWTANSSPGTTPTSTSSPTRCTTDSASSRGSAATARRTIARRCSGSASTCGDSSSRRTST